MLPFPAVVHLAHIPLGMVTVDLAVGVAAFVLWQALYGPVLAALSPIAWHIPAPSGLRFHFGRWSRAARTLAAILLGIGTHIIWDSFTHDWMWGTVHIPWLAAPHGPLLGWQWVGRISDVVGLAVVAAWVLRWWRKRSRASKSIGAPAWLVWLAWLAILLPFTSGFLYWYLNDSFYLGITRAAGLGVLGLTAVSLIWRSVLTSRGYRPKETPHAHLDPS